MNRAFQIFSVFALLIVFCLPVVLLPLMSAHAQTPTEQPDAPFDEEDENVTPTSTTPVPIEPGPRPGAFEYAPLTGIPGVTEGNSLSLAAYLNALFRIAIGLAALVAVIQITLAGIKYMSDTGSFSTKEEAKRNITNALLGLLIILSVVVVFRLINENILNLNVLSELPPLGNVVPNLPPEQQVEWLIYNNRLQGNLLNEANTFCQTEFFSQIAPISGQNCIFAVNMQHLNNRERGMVTQRCATIRTPLAPHGGQYRWFTPESADADPDGEYLVCGINPDATG